MKHIKHFFAVMVLTLVASDVFAWGITWESFGSYGWKSIEPLDRYTVGANGNDLRVYEWITQVEPKQKCIFVAAEVGVSLQCDLLPKTGTVSQ